MEDADYAAARKYQNVESFLGNAGFSDFYYNDWYDKKPRTDSIGVAFGNKQISDSNTGETFTLIAVGIRGGGYEREWVGNVTAGERGFHQGFKTASDQVLSELKYYIEQHEIAGDVKIWINALILENRILLFPVSELWI